MHSDFSDEVFEVVRAGDEIGFAVNLHQDARFAVVVDVSVYKALVRTAFRLFAHYSKAFFSQSFLGLVKVSLAFEQGILAIEHPRTGHGTKLFDFIGRWFVIRHYSSLPAFRASRELLFACLRVLLPFLSAAKNNADL
jgi:hypothetical protein